MHYNYQDKNLLFIKEKIKEIKIGLFKSEINSELQLPNNIVEILKVEDDGTAWFFTSCIESQAENIARSFYAYLDFHKRGTDCRLQLGGKATIIEDDDLLFSISNYSRGTAGKLLLVKMKIMQAEYFESKQSGNVSWTDKLKLAFNHIFLQPLHKVYDFS
jgi:hypothetical protein